MWLRMGIASLMLLALACPNSPPGKTSMIFVDESCTKRRIDKIDGQGVIVSTYAQDGKQMTETARFNTWEEASQAFPSRTSGPCPALESDPDLFPQE